MRRATSLLLALVALLPARARADAADDLDECVDGAVSAMRARGARVVGEPVVGFLREGQSRTVTFRLEQAGCVGLLAVGHRRVHDIDLALYTESGISLVQDVEVNATPYLRFCGVEGLRLGAVVHMYKGQGEFQLVRFEQAPATLPDLDRTLGGCFAGGGGMRRPSADVGPAPPGRALASGMVHLSEELRSLGYRAEGAEQAGSLPPRQRQMHAVRLEAGRCYAIAAVGDAGVADLDLFVRSLAGAELARDVARDARAVAKLCSAEGGEHAIEVRMFQGNGDYRVQSFVLDEPPPRERPPGVEGDARIGFAEATTRIGARGMAVRPVAWGRLAPGEILRMPVRLEAGRCYAFAGVGASELSQGDLDVILLDEGDALMAWDVGPGSSPIVWHCAEHAGVVWVAGRVYGAAGRYLVLMGEDR